MSVLVYSIIASAVGLSIIMIFLAACKILRNKSRRRSSVIAFDEGSESIGLNKKDETHYISYYCDNDGVTKTAIRIASWLKQHNINVVMDKFNVITNERIWCESHLSAAKRVVMILSPAYLKICRFDENMGKEVKLDSVKDQLAYNEICHIRDEIRKHPMATNRFVIISNGVDSNELPFWMKRFNIYKYSKGSLDEGILKVLKE